VTRRDLLLFPGAALIARAAPPPSEPLNLAFPLKDVQGALTKPDRFFVRDHFPPPELSLEDWKLRIEGRVDNPYDVSFSDLLELPARKVEAVLECAGNLAGGAAVSNGVWHGVPISALLNSAKLQSDAAFLLLEGSDSGRLLQDGPVLPYSQLVPLSKCLDDASLIAFKLNDRFLPVRNGFPARALFSGWYGMDSVKWLRRIEVLAAEDMNSTFYRSGMDRLYNRILSVDGARRTTRLTSIQVKSAIAWPAAAMKLPAGRHLVWGFAWSGNGAIRDVAVTNDGGKQWNPAKLQSKGEPYSWVRWNYSWEAKPGEYALMSRASDRNGPQPMVRDGMRKDAYELNWCAPVRCSVR
jgi:DMSO/TMAO reductase YedYZ molybdopterin-dependent catalytic subunit